MPWTLSTNWQPKELLTVGASADTSTGVTEVTTDAGRAYIKPVGNRQGPHVLATDWVGTHLARWFGLEFRNRLREDIISGCATRLRQMDAETVGSIVGTVPRVWDVPSEARRAWAELIFRRARFVADNVQKWIENIAPWFGEQGE